MFAKSSYISTALLIVLVMIIAASLFLASFKYLVRKDFTVEAKIVCNPDTESCFKEECETGDPRCDSDGVLFFKVITKKAYIDIPFQECQKHTQCEVVYCDEDNLADYSEFETCF